MSRIWDSLLSQQAPDTIPDKDLDSWLIIGQNRSVIIDWIVSHFDAQTILKFKNADPVTVVVAPFNDPTDPLVVHIATTANDVAGLVYYEIIDLCDISVIWGNNSLSDAGKATLRDAAQRRRRVRNDRTTYIHPAPRRDREIEERYGGYLQECEQNGRTPMPRQRDLRWVMHHNAMRQAAKDTFNRFRGNTTMARMSMAEQHHLAPPSKILFP